MQVIKLWNKNDKDVYEFLQKQRIPVKRDVIVEETGIARTTVYDALKRLERKGLIVRRQLNLSKKRGRPPVYWALKETWEFYDRWMLLNE